jgi:2-dehydropantoate 2-reductase
MKFDNIIMLGAGVIGSCYGALLSARNRVIMVDNKVVVDKINNKGITIIMNNEKKFKPEAQTDLNEIMPNTLILLTTKAHQTEAAIQKVKNLLLDDTVILILQNGLGNEHIVKKATGDKVEVIRGIVNSGAWEIQPGRFNLILHETVLEPTSTSSSITQIFNESDLPAKVSQSFISELWQKLILNCVVNPLTAILRVRNNQIGVPVLENLRHHILEECLKVAKAEGLNLNTDLCEKLDKAIQSYSNFSSMYQDVMNGKKTEIDFLNGRIVELGKKHNIPTLCNEALYAIIKFMEPKNDIG